VVYFIQYIIIHMYIQYIIIIIIILIIQYKRNDLSLNTYKLDAIEFHIFFHADWAASKEPTTVTIRTVEKGYPTGYLYVQHFNSVEIDLVCVISVVFGDNDFTKTTIYHSYWHYYRNSNCNYSYLVNCVIFLVIVFITIH